MESMSIRTIIQGRSHLSRDYKDSSKTTTKCKHPSPTLGGDLMQQYESLQLYMPRTDAYWRACSLDVEIAASGYTKEMQEDDELLHPGGPEDETEDNPSQFLDDEASKTQTCSTEEDHKVLNDSDDSETLSSDGLNQEDIDSQKEERGQIVQGLDLAAFSLALEELEGKNIGEKPCHIDSPDVDCVEDVKVDENTILDPGDAEQDKPTAYLREYEEECPDLVALSAANKEFQPFR